MPTLHIDITAVTDDGGGKGTGTYDKKRGPGQVETNGDISLKSQAEVDIAWTITASGFKFASPGYSAPKITQFGAPDNSGSDATCTIEDTNKELGFKYTLHLLDSSGAAIDLDPKVINR
jgi:hypothetical protein